MKNSSETKISIKDEWYEALVEDCKAILVESVFGSRWILVEGYHNLGERITSDENFQKYAKGNHASLQSLAKNLKISERTLYYAIKFFVSYPHLDKVPEGKNITWNKIITKYLPSPQEHHTCQEFKEVGAWRCVECNKLQLNDPEKK